MTKLNLQNPAANINQIIRNYNLGVTANNHYLFDGDLEELFSDSDITVTNNVYHKAKDWQYDKDGCWLIGCKDGDYLETVELEQNGTVYLCQAFANCCGEGLDYTLALENVEEQVEVED